MLKLIFTLVCLAAVAHAQYCPFGSFNQFGAQRTRYCYKPLGTTVFFHEAVERCGKERLSLVTPKTDAGLNDLNILFRAGVQNQAFWVGAHSTPSKPMNFVFQDNLPLYNNHFCRGEPKNHDNLCGLHLGTEASCVSSGQCKTNFPIGVWCQTTSN